MHLREIGKRNGKISAEPQKKGENSETSLNCSTDSTGCNSFASRSALLPAVHGDDSFAAMSTLCHVQQATKSLKKSLKKVISIDSY